MPTLREIQQQFAAAVYDNDSSLAPHICETDGILAHQRLSIYRASVIGIQSDALASVYPVLDQLVGERFFSTLCKAYLSTNSSPSGDLHQLGKNMDTFLQNYSAVDSLPYLPDIAKIEWAYHQAFHAANDLDFSFEDFGEVPPEKQNQLVFGLSNSLTLIQSPWPIDHIWAANQKDNNEAEQIIDLNEGGSNILVWRHYRHVELIPLPAEQWAFLSAVKNRRTLGQMLEQPSLSPFISTALPLCIQAKWITHFHLQAPLKPNSKS